MVKHIATLFYIIWCILHIFQKQLSVRANVISRQNHGIYIIIKHERNMLKNLGEEGRWRNIEFREITPTFTYKGFSKYLLLFFINMSPVYLRMFLNSISVKFCEVHKISTVYRIEYPDILSKFMLQIISILSGRNL